MFIFAKCIRTLLQYLLQLFDLSSAPSL